MMKNPVKKAIAALVKIGAPVIEVANGNPAVFIIGGELRNSNDHYYADYYQHEIKERAENGVIVNAHGVREDVRKILARHGLYGEWINPAQLGVFVN